MQLEEIALADDYFIERKLYPNVDFYTGLIYKAMGFPTRMFTVLFALGRLPGWIAQWREMIEDPETKIGRPRQIYIGATERDVRRPRRPLSAATDRATDTRAAHLRRGVGPLCALTGRRGRREPGTASGQAQHDGGGSHGRAGRRCHVQPLSSRLRGPRAVADGDRSSVPWWSALATAHCAGGPGARPAELSRAASPSARRRPGHARARP